MFYNWHSPIVRYNLTCWILSIEYNVSFLNSVHSPEKQLTNWLHPCSEVPVEPFWEGRYVSYPSSDYTFASFYPSEIPRFRPKMREKSSVEAIFQGSSMFCLKPRFLSEFIRKFADKFVFLCKKKSLFQHSEVKDWQILSDEGTFLYFHRLKRGDRNVHSLIWLRC